MRTWRADGDGRLAIRLQHLTRTSGRQRSGPRRRRRTPLRCEPVLLLRVELPPDTVPDLEPGDAVIDCVNRTDEVQTDPDGETSSGDDRELAGAEHRVVNC